MKKYLNIEYHPMDSRIKLLEGGVAQTLSERMGTGGGNVPLILELFYGDDDTEDIDGETLL